MAAINTRVSDGGFNNNQGYTVANTYATSLPQVTKTTQHNPTNGTALSFAQTNGTFDGGPAGSYIPNQYNGKSNLGSFEDGPAGSYIAPATTTKNFQFTGNLAAGARPNIDTRTTTPTTEDNSGVDLPKDLGFQDLGFDPLGIFGSKSLGGGGVGYSYTPITWDKDGYISNRYNSLKELADQGYNANANAAQNTRDQTVADALNVYQSGRRQQQMNKEDMLRNKQSSEASAGQNAYNSLRQQQEAMSSQGLTNSGLGAAMTQAQRTALNNQLATIDQQYNQQVAQANQEISRLVEQYGLSEQSANKILNNTLQTLETNRQSAYREALNTATSESMQYQLEVDKTNASNIASLEAARMQANASIQAASMSILSQDRWNQFQNLQDGQLDYIDRLATVYGNNTEVGNYLVAMQMYAGYMSNNELYTRLARGLEQFGIDS